MATVWGWLVAFSDLIEHHIGAITAVIAGAAIFQWRETRKTAERQLRAYVTHCSISLLEASQLENKPFVDRTGQAGVSVVIKNFGQTPANGVVHWMEIQVAPVDREWAMSAPEKLEKTFPTSLGPGHTTSNSRWLNRAISPEEAIGITKGTYAVYAYGRIEYRDAFRYKRWATYRLKYTNAAWPPIGKSGSMGFCSQGNDSN